MCTVSWSWSGASYELLCNRDERKTRAPAIPPKSAPEVLSPRDPEGGGTWIAVNASGVSIALLNGANAGPGTLSRGLLPARLIRLENTTNINAEMATIDYNDFAPFTLLLIASNEPAHIYTWNGANILHQTDPNQQGLLTSSSMDAPGARAYRTALFENEPSLETFHKSHGLSPSAYSPCMHRVDAETVSFSRIRVTPESITFLYKPTAPCRSGPEETSAITCSSGSPSAH